MAAAREELERKRRAREEREREQRERNRKAIDEKDADAEQRMLSKVLAKWTKQLRSRAFNKLRDDAAMRRRQLNLIHRCRQKWVGAKTLRYLVALREYAESSQIRQLEKEAKAMRANKQRSKLSPRGRGSGPGGRSGPTF